MLCSGFKHGNKPQTTLLDYIVAISNLINTLQSYVNDSRVVLTRKFPT